MFTKIANGALGLGIAAGVIGSIFLGVNAGKNSNGFVGFIVFLLGCVVTLVASTGVGVIVEMANNILDCRNFLESICQEKESGAKNNISKRESAPSYDLLKMHKEEHEKNTSNNQETQNRYWNCPNCGEQNTAETRFCMHCGTPKS